MKRRSLFICLTLIPFILNAQSNIVNIEVHSPLDIAHSMVYTLSDNQICVRIGTKNKKHVFKMNEDMNNKLRLLIITEVFMLDTLYYSEVMDGVTWEFDFAIDGQRKKIRLVNSYQQVLDNLIEIINESLADKYKLPRPGMFNYRR